MTSINTGGLELNLQLINNIRSTSSGLKNNKINSAAIYAEKGDPLYQKDMDLDEDGVITLEEFNDYCDEHDISYAERQQMLQNRLEYQLHNDRARISSEIREIKSEAEAVYAKKGDEKYDKDMDENEDGKITYDEYLKYCEENSSHDKESSDVTIEKNDSSDTEEEVIIRSSAKAISKYAKSENSEAEGKVQNEA